MSNKTMEKLTVGLLNARQYLRYLEALDTDITDLRTRLRSLDRELASNVQEISVIVEDRKSVPTDRVFPQFIRLAK